MDRDGNAIELQQPDPLRFAHPYRFCIGQFLGRKRNAYAQHSLLLFARPIRRQRQEHFKLFDYRLAVQTITIRYASS